MTDNQLSFLPDSVSRPIFEGEITVAELLEKLEDVDGVSPVEYTETTKEFRDSILTYGIINPITLTISNPAAHDYHDTYTIAAGRRRLKAALELHMTTVPVRVYDGDLVSPDAITVIENSQRAENIVSEYLAIQRIMGRARVEGETPTLSLIHKLTGMNVGTIKKRLELANLHQTLFEAMRQGKISPSVAEKVCKLDLSEQEMLIPVLQQNKKLTAHDVKTVRSTNAAQAFAELPLDLFDAPATETPTNAPNQIHVLLRVQLDNHMAVVACSFNKQTLTDMIDDEQNAHPEDKVHVVRARFIQ